MSSDARPPEAVMAAALTQLAALRDEIAGLAGARARDAAQLRAQAAALRRRTRQLPAAAARKAVRQQRRTAPGDGRAYRPVPAQRWWQLQGRERAAAVARLRAWVETVFRPGYGHLAAQVGPCWQEHDLCLYQLAWLSGDARGDVPFARAPARQRGRLAYPAASRSRDADGRGNQPL